MATIRCNHCDTVFDSQKTVSGTVVVEQHAASDCPGCGGQAHQARALLPHHRVIDAEYRAIPDPGVAYVPPVPLAAETYAKMQELITKLQGQIAEQDKRQLDIQRSLENLAKQPLRPSLAGAVVEPPAVGEAHLAEALKTTEAPAAPAK
jgi:hypothetical protein